MCLANPFSPSRRSGATLAVPFDSSTIPPLPPTTPNTSAPYKRSELLVSWSHRPSRSFRILQALSVFLHKTIKVTTPTSSPNRSGRTRAASPASNPDPDPKPV
ncbi:hypothetical protein AVEN_164842-1 [Araneus ventricosus]|uniref:Uncharacterized protein n=1 Tax=Araneus ventricosus TaxID=182803 RepID=A0A4Y2IR56_ARAVE|nr:hypothetical protein AVEN_164842-1 [Araneus ventricosus]